MPALYPEQIWLLLMCSSKVKGNFSPYPSNAAASTMDLLQSESSILRAQIQVDYYHKLHGNRTGSQPCLQHPGCPPTILPAAFPPPAPKHLLSASTPHNLFFSRTCISMGKLGQVPCTSLFPGRGAQKYRVAQKRYM